MKITSAAILLLQCFIIWISIPEAGSVPMELSEAEQIALEYSNELIPEPALAYRIARDLTAIRYEFPIVSEISHSRKWQPGKLLVYNVDDAKIEALNQLDKSIYGPVHANAIFYDSVYFLTFDQPFNPDGLVDILENEFGISDAHPDPDGDVERYSSISLTTDDEQFTYVFYKGWGDCRGGCKHKRYWTFTTGYDDSIEFVGESGDDIDAGFLDEKSSYFFSF